MPPDVREWLPKEHIAWFVIDAVEDMDLDAFDVTYRSGGRSRPAYAPAMMVALLLYAYARGVRSSRVIERACEEDVAFRVLRPSSGPITRRSRGSSSATRTRSLACSARCFRCAKQGLASVGVIAVDGTKLPGNANRNANVDYEQRARDSRTSKGGRCGRGRARWRRARPQGGAADSARPLQAAQGSQAASDEELFSEMRANRAYEHYRSGRMKDGRRFGRPPDPYTPPATPQGQINLTDPDSHVVKGSRGARVPAGLQRPSGRQRAPDRARRRGHDRCARLRASGTDARRR